MCIYDIVIFYVFIVFVLFMFVFRLMFKNVFFAFSFRVVVFLVIVCLLIVIVIFGVNFGFSGLWFLFVCIFLYIDIVIKMRNILNKIDALIKSTRREKFSVFNNRFGCCMFLFGFNCVSMGFLLLFIVIGLKLFSFGMFLCLERAFSSSTFASTSSFLIFSFGFLFGVFEFVVVVVEDEILFVVNVFV